MKRAAELATEAGQLPADRFNDHAFVVTAALQASDELVQWVEFLPVGWDGGVLRACCHSAALCCAGRCAVLQSCAAGFVGCHVLP